MSQAQIHALKAQVADLKETIRLALPALETAMNILDAARPLVLNGEVLRDSVKELRRIYYSRDIT